MNKKQKARKIAELLTVKYPKIEPPLDHSNAHELLFATILSAQCTDARVNKVTPTLFSRYPEIEDYANCNIDELKEIIRSTGFYNNKAKNIKGAAELIVSKYGGEVPDRMEDLLTLPGVARKTANVVLWQWYGKNQGFTVDTHVIRLSNWFGLVDTKNPQIIERKLMELFPQGQWGDMSLRMILLGREVLKARKPEYECTEWEELVEIK